MAKSRSKKQRAENMPLDSSPVGNPFADFMGGLESGLENANALEKTGRMIMTVLDPSKKGIEKAIKSMANLTGMSASASNVARSSDFSLDDVMDFDQLESGKYQVFEELGIVVLNGEPDELSLSSSATVQDNNVIIEPEYWNYSLGQEVVASLGEAGAGFGDEIEMSPSPSPATVNRDFLLGAKSVIDMMLGLRGEPGSALIAGISAHGACLRDTASSTWGLQAVRAHSNTLTGAGIKVCVLDTGFDINHPDFSGRSVQRQSFIPSTQPDSDLQDRNGHGTHCIGTACGSRSPGLGPRYGIASSAEIFAGKVLRQGSDGRAAGADGWILAGIDWALRHQCHIISMSLGSEAASAEFPMMYERAASAGLRAGTLIFAASGNDSSRPGLIKPVGRPANCPSIAAVAAMDGCSRVASFSNGQKFTNGGEVNFVGPGVSVLSSVPMPRRRSIFNGTSMATPHAAGVAALIAQQTGLRGIELYREMRRRALPMGPRSDFGNGLVRV